MTILIQVKLNLNVEDEYSAAMDKLLNTKEFLGYTIIHASCHNETETHKIYVAIEDEK